MDVIIFNPPYVPTPDEEVSGNDIEASWAGGVNGRRVIDRALPQIAQLLSRPRGVCYMITVDDNKPEELASILKSKYGLTMTPLVRRRACNEFLTVQKITTTASNVRFQAGNDQS
jgi:release factor glutamine methyltransferase